ncbi:MAG: FAD-dependent oxidoreductase [Candidatus Dormibacteria bacterium]
MTSPPASPPIKLYGASWCPDCRRAKKFLGEQRVEFEWQDIEKEPELVRIVEERNGGKHIIPTVVFPDDSFLAEPSNEELAEKIGLTQRARKAVYDLIVIGGGPAGLTTAIYAARENIETLVIERSGLGGQAGVTERLDNYPGFPEGVGGGELADRIVAQAQRYGVEMLQAVSVASISMDGDQRVVRTSGGDEYRSRAVLIATGSSYRRTNRPGEEELIGAGIHFCATCDGPFYKGSKDLLVLGGGNSGLEEGLFLTQFTNAVTVVEAADQLKAGRPLQEKVTQHPKMSVRLHTEVAEFVTDEGGKLGAVRLKDRSTGDESELRPDGVFVFIGLDPNVEAVKESVELSPAGFVGTSRTLETTMPGVFAAGDVREGSTKQLASAVGEGATAALMIRAYLDESGAG